jgi:hypothetical protein
MSNDDGQEPYEYNGISYEMDDTIYSPKVGNGKIKGLITWSTPYGVAAVFYPVNGEQKLMRNLKEISKFPFSGGSRKYKKTYKKQSRKRRKTRRK